MEEKHLTAEEIESQREQLLADIEEFKKQNKESLNKFLDKVAKVKFIRSKKMQKARKKSKIAKKSRKKKRQK